MCGPWAEESESFRTFEDLDVDSASSLCWRLHRVWGATVSDTNTVYTDPNSVLIPPLPLKTEERGPGVLLLFYWEPPDQEENMNMDLLDM